MIRVGRTMGRGRRAVRESGRERAQAAPARVPAGSRAGGVGVLAFRNQASAGAGLRCGLRAESPSSKIE